MRASSCAPRAARRRSWTASPAKLDKAARDLRLCFGKEGARLGWTQALREPGFRRRAAGARPGAGGARTSRSASRPSAPRAWAPARAARTRRSALLARMRLERGRRREGSALGRGVRPLAAAARHAAGAGGAVPQADAGPSARLDLHLGDARGGRGLLAFQAGAGPGGRRRAHLAQPVRFRAPGAALFAAGACRPIRTIPATPRRWSRRRCRCSRRAAAARSCCSPRCARCAARTSCCKDSDRVPAARAGHRLAQRAAGALPRARQRGAARQRPRSGKAWTCAARRCRWW